MTRGKPSCKDCLKIWNDPDLESPPKPRPAPHPGPRCSTHWRAEVKRREARAHDTRVQRTYGLEAGAYDALKKAQEGVCALCRRAKGVSKKLAVDHDHKCCPGPQSCGNCVRGLLCSPCNRMLGHGRDNPDFFARVLDYLINPPAQRRRQSTDPRDCDPFRPLRPDDDR